MERIIISKNVRDGQLLILMAFLTMFGILLLCAIMTSDFNYFLIIVFAVVFFGPIYLLFLRLFDIYIDDEHVVVRNLIRKVKHDKLSFEKVVPADSLFILGNNPYFTIVFSNGDRYNFAYRKKGLNGLFQNRVSRAQDLTRDLMKVCK